jgi:hypothetical protein
MILGNDRNSKLILTLPYDWNNAVIRVGQEIL